MREGSGDNHDVERQVPDRGYGRRTAGMEYGGAR